MQYVHDLFMRTRGDSSLLHIRKIFIVPNVQFFVFFAFLLL